MSPIQKKQPGLSWIKKAKLVPDTAKAIGPPAVEPAVDRLRKLEPVTLTIKQASAYSNLSRSFLYGLFDANLLPRLKAGKRVLILREDLDRYLASIKQPST